MKSLSEQIQNVDRENFRRVAYGLPEVHDAREPVREVQQVMPREDIVIIARQLLLHGIIGQAKVRRLQRHESSNTTNEFRAFDYISAARSHFGMSRDEAARLTMTEFQFLLAAKYPDQKGFTREEYDAVADDYLARKAKKLSTDRGNSTV